MRHHTAFLIGAALLTVAQPSLAATAVYSFSGVGELAQYSYAYDYIAGTFIRPLIDRRVGGIAFSGSFSVDLDALPANTPEFVYPTNYLSSGGSAKFLSSQFSGSFEGRDFTLTTEGLSDSIFRYSPYVGYVSQLRDQTTGTNMPVAEFDDQGRLISRSIRNGWSSLGGVDYSSDVVNGIRIPLFEGLVGNVGASAGLATIVETYAYPGGVLATYDYDSWSFVGGVKVTLTGVQFDPPPPPPPPPPPAVPEPATWAMMVGGFGLLGAAARRRPRATVTYA